MFLNKIIYSVKNKFKTNKKPDEYPDLPLDFKNLDCKPKI